MKKLLLILLPISIFLVSCGGDDEINPVNPSYNSMYTYVPNNDFELFLINQGLDNILNDTVLTAAIDTLKELDIYGNFHSLTGIENFISLERLRIIDEKGNLNSIDITNLTELREFEISDECNGNNSFNNIDFSKNTKLTDLTIHCINLNSINLNQNNNLISFSIVGTEIQYLDVSNNPNLTSLVCGWNELVSLNIKNGNNTNLSLFNCEENDNLYCIEVDDVNYANSNFIDIPSQSYFSEDCGVK